ncbi:MAG TPA: BatA and WFA domain-containing protein [Phototrophicaceae bacterium]|nr:BatA and WFA domain-containing protein [Phototrophicaceae bacterium]
MSFLTPIAFIGGLLAIPIVLMYMLRLRRREVTVSSTMLWQQLLHDREANTPWQRLRRNLLLLLQLIILALLVFALARPFIVVPAVSSGQIAVLLDASASMNATDADSGTRFDDAKQQALGIVDTMNPGDTMTVIRVAGSPEVLVPYTGDQSLLRNAITGAQPSASSADWTAALTLAAAGSQGSADFNAVIISDGGLGDSAQLPAIPGTLRYIPIGKASDNLAISALATRALPGQPPQLFAQISNYGSDAARVVFDLTVDGKLLAAQDVDVPAAQNGEPGTVPFVSQNLPAQFKTIEAGLTLPVNSTYTDYLPQDNTAWAVAGDSGTRHVLLMSSGNLFLDQVLRSLPSVNLVDGDPTKGLPTNPYDLYIFDGWQPTTLPPSGDILFVNPPASNALFTVGGEITKTSNPTVMRNDPRMTYVDFSTVNILKFKQVTASWATPLISVDGGPLLLAGETGGRQVAILTFDLRDSDLPLQIEWPILMSSLLNWYSPQDLISAPNGLKVGDTLAITPLADSTSVRVTEPDGTIKTLDYGGAPLSFADTAAPGLYTVASLKGEQVEQSASFAVNLFDPNESNITPQTTLKLGSTTVSQAVEAEIGQKEYWPYLALGALIILLVEWYVYFRRLRAPTLFKPLRGVKVS